MSLPARDSWWPVLPVQTPRPVQTPNAYTISPLCLQHIGTPYVDVLVLVGGALSQDGEKMAEPYPGLHELILLHIPNH